MNEFLKRLDPNNPQDNWTGITYHRRHGQPDEVVDCVDRLAFQLTKLSAQSLLDNLRWAVDYKIENLCVPKSMGKEKPIYKEGVPKRAYVHDVYLYKCECGWEGYKVINEGTMGHALVQHNNLILLHNRHRLSDWVERVGNLIADRFSGQDNLDYPVDVLFADEKTKKQIAKACYENPEMREEFALIFKETNPQPQHPLAIYLDCLKIYMVGKTWFEWLIEAFDEDLGVTLQGNGEDPEWIGDATGGYKWRIHHREGQETLCGQFCPKLPLFQSGVET